MSKHTPGPWTAEMEIDINGYETGKLWIVMNGQPCAYEFDRFEDAQLASAAPELLEAAKEIVSLVYREGRGGVVEFRPHEFDDLKAAIARAEGGQP